MNFSTLNALYYSADDAEAVEHYTVAMRNRGWEPDLLEYAQTVQRKRGEALEEGGRASKTNLEQPDQPHVGPLCRCLDWQPEEGPVS